MKFPFDEKALLYRELAKLSTSGFPLPEAVDAVTDTRPPNATLTVLREVKSGLAVGMTIGEAFSDLRVVKLSEMEESMIGAAERGGALADGFGHLADYFQMRAKTAKQMRRKMVYPLVLLHVAIFVPVIPLMIGAQDPARVLLVSALTLLGAYLVLFAATVVGRKLAARAETDPATDRRLARLPLVGSVRQNLALARFTSVYRMHLLAGERVDAGLRSAALASRSGRIRHSVETRAIPAVEDGQPVGPALTADKEVFTAAFARGFTTAESAGALDTDLLRWAARFEDAARGAMEKLGSHAPKYFYAFIVLIAVWQIYRLVAKIFGEYGKLFNLIDGQ